MCSSFPYGQTGGLCGCWEGGAEGDTLAVPGRRGTGGALSSHGLLEPVTWVLAEDFEHAFEEAVDPALVGFHEFVEFREIDFGAFEAVGEIIDEGETVVTEAEFAAEVGFVGGGHADDVAPALDDTDFGFGLKARPAHLHVGFTGVDGEFVAESFADLSDKVVGDARRGAFEFLVKKGLRSVLEANVVRTGNEGAGAEGGVEGTDRVEGNDVGETKFSESFNVGPIIDAVRGQRELVAVPVDEDVIAARFVSDGTVFRLDGFNFPGGKEVGLYDAGAADKRYFHMSQLTSAEPAKTTTKAGLVGGLLLMWLGGCATPGPTHLYMAGAGDRPVWDHSLQGEDHDAIGGLLAETDQVVGLGYEYNTDYIWLRMAPGDRLVTIKRSMRQVWYDYDLPAAFAANESMPLDLAVRAFNRMVYAAMPEPGVVGKVTRYGKVQVSFRPGGEPRVIGGLAWDQVADQLLVLYVDEGEVVAYANESDATRRVKLQADVDAWSMGYDSNRSRYYVPLRGGEWIGEFDAQGRLIDRLALPDGVRGIDAGQRALVRIF